jgi:hypothetical protein
MTFRYLFIISMFFNIRLLLDLRESKNIFEFLAASYSKELYRCHESVLKSCVEAKVPEWKKNFEGAYKFNTGRTSK